MKRRYLIPVMLVFLATAAGVLPSCQSATPSTSLPSSASPASPASSVLVTTQPTVSTVKPTATETSTQPVPAEYAGLYANLKAALDSFDATLASQSARPTNPVTFSAELLAANGNRGEELLKPGVMDSVNLTLNRFQELGIQAVTFPIGYPLYTDTYPRHEEYVQFFKQVVQEIKRRGMTVDIESAVIFANTDFSPIVTSFKGLTFDQFKVEKAKMEQDIINDLRPDYINLGCEPTTMASLLGMKELNDPAKYTEYVNYILQHIDRGTTKVIAGLGTWDDITYAKDILSQTNIDCLAIHIYPVVGDDLSKAITIAEMAAQYKKPIVLDECWLYKTDKLAGGPVASSDIFRKDSYSFFSPLDQQFLSEMVDFARHYNVVYISPFWTTFFFGEVDYSATDAGATYTQLSAQANLIASANMRNDKFTALGKAYQKLIQANR